jgi:hypothetical protein
MEKRCTLLLHIRNIMGTSVLENILKTVSANYLCSTASIPVDSAQRGAFCPRAAVPYAAGVMPTTSPVPRSPHSAARSRPISPSWPQPPLAASVAATRSRSTTAAANTPPGPPPQPAAAVSIAAAKSAATVGLYWRRRAQVTVRSWADAVTRSTPLDFPAIAGEPVAGASSAAATAEDDGAAAEMRWWSWRHGCRAGQVVWCFMARGRILAALGQQHDVPALGGGGGAVIWGK